MPAWAQPGAQVLRPDLEALQGRPVRRIVIRTAAPTPGAEAPPLTPEEETLARNQLRLGEGAPFDGAVVSQDVSRLNRLGRYRRVEATGSLLEDGSVEVVYTLVPQPLITAVQTVGNRVFEDNELVGGLRLEGTPVDPTSLERIARRIEDQYRGRGYYNARVSVDQEELDRSGIVVFRIREGLKTRVAEIRFEGVTAFTARQLRGKLKTKEAGFFDFITDTGTIDDTLLDEDVGAIVNHYRDRGYLDVRVDRTITPSPDGREAVVVFLVEEGRPYVLRDIRVEYGPGEEAVLAPEQVVPLLRLRAGDVYSEALMRESQKAIEGALGVMGYADARVGRRLLREPGEPVVDVVLVVMPGRAYRTGMIEIRGNTATRGDVIREQITLRPERPLDPAEIEESRRRLERTRLFAPRSVKASVLAERPDEPGYRDVLFEVEETTTRSFSVGVGVSSDASVQAQVAVTQRNFDITDWPDSWSELWTGEAFHGGGQTFSIEARPGDRVRTFSVSLSDPSAWGTDYSAGGSVYFRDRLYRSYTEQRVGGRLTVGRRFGSRWQIGVPLSLEKIQLRDIDPDAPTEYFEHEDGDLLASVGLTLSRTSMDDPTFPSRGSKIELGVAQYAGDFNFTRLSAEYSRYLKIAEDALGLKTVLQLTTRATYIPQDQADVPFYERGYLGGSSFRGFSFRGVGPVGVRADNGQPSDDSVGGVFTFFAGAELRRPILTELLSGVVFIDTGTVEDSLGFNDYRISAGFGLRIYIERLSSVPLAFDFGFPILREDTDDSQFFNFSFDLPFR
jgi:outer membrane protein insertion porin family